MGLWFVVCDLWLMICGLWVVFCVFVFRGVYFVAFVFWCEVLWFEACGLFFVVYVRGDKKSVRGEKIVHNFHQ
jgi:hypothetical protein